MQPHLLKSIPLFANLSDREREELARLVVLRQLPAREALFWIGDPGDEFFIVLSGRVEISYPDDAGREVVLAVLKPGDFLGEISLLDGGPRTATARARDDITLLCLQREAFHTFVRSSPAAALQIMTVLGRRQRDTVDRLRGIRNLNEVMEERLTRWQRVADMITALIGSEAFLIAHAAVFGCYILLNLVLRSRAFDPFPFPFLCFWFSGEAIFLALFIMVSQNAQRRKDQLRTELEYQVALKMQVEIMQLHRRLDELPAAVLEQLRAAPRSGGEGDAASAAVLADAVAALDDTPFDVGQPATPGG